MKNIESKEELEQLKMFIFVSLISADNEEYSEDIKQEIIKRYDKKPFNEINWDYVLDPLGEDKYKYLKILTA